MSEFFDVDLNRLHEEWVRQPKLYHRYAMQSADARDRWERAKAEHAVMEAELDEVQAQVSLKIRRNPDAYNIDKATEDAVKKAVLLQSEYKTAQRRLFDAATKVIRCKSELDHCEAAVKTLDHKKAALEDLVRLRLAHYFAEPKEPKESDGKLDRERGADAFKRPKQER